MSYCKNCGAELPEGASFCINCGTSCMDATTPPKTPLTDEHEKCVKRCKTAKVLLIISSVLAFYHALQALLSAPIFMLLGFLFIVFGIPTAALGLGFIFIFYGVIFLLLIAVSVVSAIINAIPGLLGLLSLKQVFGKNHKSCRRTWAIVLIIVNAFIYIDVISLLYSILGGPVGIISWAISCAPGITGIIASILLLCAKDANLPECETAEKVKTEK